MRLSVRIPPPLASNHGAHRSVVGVKVYHHNTTSGISVFVDKAFYMLLDKRKRVALCHLLSEASHAHTVRADNGIAGALPLTGGSPSADRLSASAFRENGFKSEEWPFEIAIAKPRRCEADRYREKIEGRLPDQDSAWEGRK